MMCSIFTSLSSYLYGMMCLLENRIIAGTMNIPALCGDNETGEMVYVSISLFFKLVINEQKIIKLRPAKPLLVLFKNYIKFP